MSIYNCQKVQRFYAMKSRVLYKQILGTVLLTFFVTANESLPIKESRPAKSMESRPLVSTGGHKREDIFNIILKVNLKANKIPVGMMAIGNHYKEPQQLFQGDIVMTSDIRKALANSHTDYMTLPGREKRGQGRHRRAASSRAQDKWPIVNGQVEVPYVIDSSSMSDKTVITQALDHWHSKVPCIAFVPRSNQPDYLTFFSGQGCFSYTGRTGGNQRISIGTGCAVLGVIVHEIGHALGFWHEQSRPDRDNYVKILWDNILPDKYDDFKMISNADTNDLGVPYDLGSLMHYGPNAFSKNDLPTIESLNGSTNFGQRNGLSDKDIQQARLLYCPRTNACKTLYTDLNENCTNWYAHGQCDHQSYNQYMSVNCKKSCICQVCEDRDSSCRSFVQAGYCTAYKEYMSLYCRKGCGFCK